jgi:hypothetical protein
MLAISLKHELTSKASWLSELYCSTCFELEHAINIR